MVRKGADNCPESHRDLALQSLEKKKQQEAFQQEKTQGEMLVTCTKREKGDQRASQCSWSHLHLLCALLKELTPQPVH